MNDWFSPVIIIVSGLLFFALVSGILWSVGKGIKPPKKPKKKV